MEKKSFPAGFEHWILNFHHHPTILKIAKIEYAYHKMAINAGIEMSDCKLFEGKSGKSYSVPKD